MQSQLNTLPHDHAHATAHNIMLSGKMDLLDPFQIRRETIMLVNERLSDPFRVFMMSQLKLKHVWFSTKSVGILPIK
ncbi:hypothetical protein GJ744_011615 [Endocarpon pusillum]|uniref:Uncharacterized protein n=1 Tax=Endocarpon pusillum TaxID=364733 RepID=A0A8H7E3B5_9EURO|nr:hypothetical protein GJ744_011615 [Endocarpon pusillum]